MRVFLGTILGPTVLYFHSFSTNRILCIADTERMFWYETSNMFRAVTHDSLCFILNPKFLGLHLHFNSKNHIYFLVLQTSQVLHFHQRSLGSHSYKNHAKRSFELDFVRKNTCYWRSLSTRTLSKVSF